MFEGSPAAVEEAYVDYAPFADPTALVFQVSQSLGRLCMASNESTFPVAVGWPVFH